MIMNDVLSMKPHDTTCSHEQLFSVQPPARDTNQCNGYMTTGDILHSFEDGSHKYDIFTILH